ncbi:hypothetical protein [Sphingosinicella sp. LY1275]|nr:hypothetical protein [Sphingosinicella sp. LY1275]MEA1013956.1 hypothetical protein [Sphingosinicella sp. LY1275]
MTVSDELVDRLAFVGFTLADRALLDEFRPVLDALTRKVSAFVASVRAA